jgi:hypothetical protein
LEEMAVGAVIMHWLFAVIAVVVVVVVVAIVAAAVAVDMGVDCNHFLRL